MFPSLACRFVSQVTTAPFPLANHMNQIIIINHATGLQTRLINCDPAQSGFLPTPLYNPLTNAEFTELWPYIITILLAGVCVRVLLRVFNQ